MNTVKTERKGMTSYTEKINTHVPPGWCVDTTFAYGDIPDPLKMYRGKDCAEKFVKYIEKEKSGCMKHFHATHGKAYQCVEERTRGSRKVSHLP